MKRKDTLKTFTIMIPYSVWIKPVNGGYIVDWGGGNEATRVTLAEALELVRDLLSGVPIEPTKGEPPSRRERGG